MVSIVSKALGYLNIRQAEQSKVLLSLLLGFLVSSIQNYLSAVPLALFLTYFSSNNLPQVYLLTAGLAIVLGTIYTFFEYRLSFNRLTLGVLIVITVVTTTFWLGLVITDSIWLIAALFVWALAAYDLTDVPFWALLNRIYTLEQGKRLFGLIGAGQNIGGLIAGCLAPVWIYLIGTEQIILLIGIFGILAVFVLFLLQRMALKSDEPEEQEEVEEEKIELKKVIRNPLIIKLTMMVALGILGTYVVDIIFNTAAEDRYTDEQSLAGFLSVFYGLVDGAGLLLGSFVFARVLRRFGLVAGLLVMPAICSTFSFLLFITHLVPPFVVLAFWILSILKFSEESLRENLTDISLVLLIQPLSEKIRSFVQTKMDMIIVPTSTAVISVVLILLNNTIGINIPIYALIAAGIYSAYLCVIYTLKPHYIRELTNAIANRYFRPKELITLDKDSLNLFVPYLSSKYADEVVSALAAIEKISPQDLGEALQTVISSQNTRVRAIALQKIAQHQLQQYKDTVMNLVNNDPNEEIRAESLKTAVKLNHPRIQEKIRNLLDDPSLHLRATAIIEAFRIKAPYLSKSEEKLKELLRSSDAMDERMGIFVIGEINQPQMNKLLNEFIKEKNKSIRGEAIYAVLKTKKMDLYAEILRQLKIINLSGDMLSAFLNLKDAIVPIIEENFSRYSTPTQIKLLRYLGAINTDRAQAFLEKIALGKEGALRRQALQALIYIKKESSPDFVENLESRIILEIDFLNLQYTELLQVPAIESAFLLRDIIERRIALSLDNLLLLLALSYFNHGFVRAKMGLESKSESEISYAVELIDSTLKTHHKKLIIPVLNKLFFEERLASATFDSPDFHEVLRKNLEVNTGTMLDLLGVMAVLYIIKKENLTSFDKEIQELENSSIEVIKETVQWVKE